MGKYLLDATAHLYKRVSVRPSVRPSVRRSIRRSVTHELKSCKSAVLDQNYWQYEHERILCRVYGLVWMTLYRRTVMHTIEQYCN